MKVSRGLLLGPAFKGVDRCPVDLAAFKAVCGARFRVPQVGSTPTRSRQDKFRGPTAMSDPKKDGSAQKRMPQRLRTGIGKKERAPGEIRHYTPEEIEAFLQARGAELQQSECDA